MVKPGVLPARDPQILQKVDAMSTDDAVQFVKAHVVPASYPNVSLQCELRQLGDCSPPGHALQHVDTYQWLDWCITAGVTV